MKELEIMYLLKVQSSYIICVCAMNKMDAKKKKKKDELVRLTHCLIIWNLTASSFEKWKTPSLEAAFAMLGS